MSGSRSSPPPAPAGGGDPSMEDILSSIRRILAEDEPPAPDATTEPAKPAAAPPRPAGMDNNVLVLDDTMMVQAPRPTQAPAPAAPNDGLVAEEAAAAAASAVGSLVRTLTADRSPALHAGGPTVEEVVRDLLRPLVKEWLDAQLPGLVERVVRGEIERVVGRAV
jgi:uncharacterized protein